MNYTNDDYMTYDTDLHMYILTSDAVAEKDGVDLYKYFENSDNPDVDIHNFLSRVSQKVYNYIYSYNLNNIDQKRYMLSLPKYRAFIQTALLAEVYSTCKNLTDPSIFYKTLSSTYQTLPVSDYVNMVLAGNGLLYNGYYTGLPEDYLDNLGITY
jgi:hypothetical protein